MRANSLQKMILIGAVVGMFPGAPAQAQSSPWAWVAGYSSYKLRPRNGTDELLNGWALGGEYTFHPGWAAEASFNHQTGTEANVISLRQQGVMVGPKYTWAIGGKFQGFTHFLIGREQYQAREGNNEDERTSFAYGLGVGLDLPLAPHLKARGQVDFIRTHYAGEAQGSPALFVGLVYRH